MSTPGTRHRWLIALHVLALVIAVVVTATFAMSMGGADTARRFLLVTIAIAGSLAWLLLRTPR